MARVLIGTSGWHYDSWRGAFFPKDLLLRYQLPYYASQFETAELNGVFYRTPTEATVRSWREQTGPDFVFAWKASKFITHWKRQSENSDNSLALMESRLALLGNKAGPILFQLPTAIRGQSRSARILFQAVAEKAALQLLISSPELIHAARPAAAGRPEHFAVSVGSRCPSLSLSRQSEMKTET